ncbi:hotdog family protein [Amycolatopsis samaneae]|uniref:Acyl-CoA thioester hydrolase n=1 Tax=Amycolatopsis samaneae TaxID=664691 RepID=A0ABW5GX42_9PSEU
MWRSDYRLRPTEIDGLGHLTATSYFGLLAETRAVWLLKSLGTSSPSCVLRTQHIEYLHEITRAARPITDHERAALAPFIPPNFRPGPRA